MTGIFITARLGSTRLPNKHLIEAQGKPFIMWLAERLINEFEDDIANGQATIFITTSANGQNEIFEGCFKDTNISVFYGSDENIPLRHLECAEANNIDKIISIDGDDILCSPRAARLVNSSLINGAQMAQTQGLPLGMNASGYNVKFLRKSLENSKYKKLETGWGKIFEKEQIEVIELNSTLDANPLRMTLDYEEDAIFFKIVIKEIGDKIIKMSDEELVKLIVENNWNGLNSGLDQIYWANFNHQKENDE